MLDSVDLNPQTAETLQQKIKSLASLMARTAESLAQGEPVELQHLADEIALIQDHVQKVSRQLQEHPLLAEQEKYVTRSGEIIDACRQIGERQQAVDLLRRLQLVKSFSPGDQEAFRQMVDQVSNLVQRLTSGNSEERRQAVRSTMGESSAFRALYELISRPEDLSDDRWLETQRLVTEAFGREVAMAVLRGRAR